MTLSTKRNSTLRIASTATNAIDNITTGGTSTSTAALLIRRLQNTGLGYATSTTGSSSYNNYNSTTSTNNTSINVNPFNIIQQNNHTGDKSVNVSFIILISMISICILVCTCVKCVGDKRRKERMQLVVVRVPVASTTTNQNNNTTTNANTSEEIVSMNNNNGTTPVLSIKEFQLLYQNEKYYNQKIVPLALQVVEQQKQEINSKRYISTPNTGVAVEQYTKEVMAAATAATCIEIVSVVVDQPTTDAKLSHTSIGNTTTITAGNSHHSTTRTTINNTNNNKNVCSICLQELQSTSCTDSSNSDKVIQNNSISHPLEKNNDIVMALPCGGTNSIFNNNNCTTTIANPEVSTSSSSTATTTQTTITRIIQRNNHEFHYDCIMSWLTKRQGNCPLCKFDIHKYVQQIK